MGVCCSSQKLDEDDILHTSKKSEIITYEQQRRVVEDVKPNLRLTLPGIDNRNSIVEDDNNNNNNNNDINTGAAVGGLKLTKADDVQEKDPEAPSNLDNSNNNIPNNIDNNPKKPTNQTISNTLPKDGIRQESKLKSQLSILTKNNPSVKPTDKERESAKEAVRHAVKSWWGTARKGISLEYLCAHTGKILPAVFKLSNDREQFTLTYTDTGKDEIYRLPNTDYITLNTTRVTEHIDQNINKKMSQIQSVQSYTPRSCLLSVSGIILLFIFADEEIATEFFACYKLTMKVLSRPS
eukprot:GHVR01157348.1.p1 GENE.GHVR01157348.1~~GHVR01157348.1.p1  ORF type:complete len:295 (+),score=54.91 GHVR01157348.1:10-894(+)